MLKVWIKGLHGSDRWHVITWNSWNPLWCLVKGRDLRFWSETCSACSYVAKLGFVSFVSGSGGLSKLWEAVESGSQCTLAAHQLRSKHTMDAPQEKHKIYLASENFRILCLQAPVQLWSCPWVRSLFLQLDMGKQSEVTLTSASEIETSLQHPCRNQWGSIGAPWGSPETENFAVFALEDPRRSPPQRRGHLWPRWRTPAVATWECKAGNRWRCLYPLRQLIVYILSTCM